MHLLKNNISLATIGVFISGVIGLLFLLFIVPIFNIRPAPEYFVRPGAISIALFSAILLQRNLNNKKDDSITSVLIRNNVLLYLLGNILATVYTILFWDMNGGGAMIPMLFVLWSFLGLPYAIALGGLSGWLASKLGHSGA
tara:strand:- start:44 stop:466 length:423 start_codon:yes stop_codon:yes gene_type:complete